MLGKIADTLTRPSAPTSSPTAKQARFVNLDGKVQVKKVNSVQWANADYQLTLDKGDLIQTGSEGVARLQFADGTTYTVKGDTLVTVEENLIESDHATRVGVHIQAGQVDLATPTWNVPGSKADISFENAVASLRENSRAEVRSDPKTQQQQMTVNEGSADMKRGGEHVEVAQWERVRFPTNGAITKDQVLAPPALISPLNLQSDYRRRSETRSDPFRVEAGGDGEGVFAANQQVNAFQQGALRKADGGHRRGHYGP